MAYPEVSGYRINALLGEGGMGAVYRATETETGREVALKVLRTADVRDKESIFRFKREAAALSAVQHPGVAAIYDMRLEGNTLYIAMELVDGESLADRIRDGKLPVREGLTIAAQLADALDAAHRAGIIHRDVKPSNVILSRGGPKLTDFGIARRLEATRLTTAGKVIGSLPYMSPEQVKGEALSPATDIYALGVVLYEMLTGKLPFDHQDDKTLSTKILTQPAPLASRKRREIPISVDVLLVKMLAKDAGLRPASAAEVAASLREAAEGRAPRGGSVHGQVRRLAALPFVALGLLGIRHAPLTRLGHRMADAVGGAARTLAGVGSPEWELVEAAFARRTARSARRDLRALERKRTLRLQTALDAETKSRTAEGELKQTLTRHADEMHGEAQLFEKRIAFLSETVARETERARVFEEKARIAAPRGRRWPWFALTIGIIAL